MDNNSVNNIVAGTVTATAEKNEYTKYDTAAALLLIPVAYAFVRLSGAADYPLGRSVVFALLFALSLVYMKKSGIRLTKNPFALGLGIVLLVLNFGLIFTSNGALQSFISFMTFLAYPYFVFALSGNSAEGCPSALFPLEMVKAFFVMPFGSISAAFEAATNSKNGKKVGKTLLMVLAGLALAFIPAVFAFYMLSYDEKFDEIMDKLFDLGSFDVISFIGDMMLTLPLAVLCFGALYSGKNRRFSGILNAEKCKNTARAVRFAPLALCLGAVAPFIVLYSIFFVSQLDYYLSAFGGVLPEGLTYASYAKNGFFELCAVSALNAFIIICISVFSSKKDERTHFALRIANAVFSVLTLILIATAMSKMAIYIGAYGLTVKRVLSGAFMLFLAVVFIMILAKQFSDKVNVILTSACAAFVICAILAFGDVNGIIADYNTDRYLSGTLEHFDCGMLYDLGDSGIIHLDRIAKNAPSEEMRQIADMRLDDMADSRASGKDGSVFALTIPRLRANAVLDDHISDN